MEEEWIDTLATINADELTFMDFVDVGQKLSTQLKEEVKTLSHDYFLNNVSQQILFCLFLFKGM